MQVLTDTITVTRIENLVIQVVVTLVYLLQTQAPIIFHMDMRVELPRCCLHQLWMEGERAPKHGKQAQLYRRLVSRLVAKGKGYGAKLVLTGSSHWEFLNLLAMSSAVSLL